MKASAAFLAGLLLARTAAAAIATVSDGAVELDPAASGESAALPEIDWGDQLLVCDFRSDDGEAKCAVLGMALAQGVRERLFELAKLNVLGFAATGALSSAGEGLVADEGLLVSARRAHCGWIVTGMVARVGGAYSLTWVLRGTAAAAQLLHGEAIGFAQGEAHRVEAQVADAVLKRMEDVPAGGILAEVPDLEMSAEAYLEYGHGLLLSLARGAEGKASTTLAQGIVDPVLRWRQLCRDASPLPAQWSEQVSISSEGWPSIRTIRHC